MKLDYEQQCYRQSEMIVRVRLQQLQNSLGEASPDQSLLEPQIPPSDCMFKSSLSDPPTAEETRMKLDYEQQCYRQSEAIVRARLQLLQNSVDEASKPASRRNLQGRTQ